MKKFVWISVAILFTFCIPSIKGQNKPATRQEESYMLGRVLSAVEDVGAGEYRTIDQKYIKEGLRKLLDINKDIDKRQYSIRLKWLAHHWYGRALLDSGDAKRALPFLETAEKEANLPSISCSTFESCINEKEKAKNSELLRQTREKLAATQN
jgi:hypothetical protein